MVFGIVLGLVLAAALQPIRDRGHLDQVLLTLGLFFIAADTVTIIWGREFHTITPPGLPDREQGDLRSLLPVRTASR